MPSTAAPTGDVTWDTLNADAGAFILLLDDAATILHASPSAAALLRVDAATLAGRTLASIFGREFAQERVELINRACNGENRVRVRGMLMGVLCTESYRAAAPRRREALMVARPCGLEADVPEIAADPPAPLAHSNHLGPLAALTERELELLHHLGHGRTSDEIAAMMHRSTRTVEWHRASLGRKLHCDNRVQLARHATRAGLTALELSLIRALHRSNAQPVAS
ncbi:MAG: helix-turn-helix transcriptional regulator [Planctomycetota bacterium]|nr:helix-turn-helix transcriptional regulator [Planctomycetota bacterium]